MKFRVILTIVLHTVIMVFAYTSPFWLDWKLIMLGLGLYYLQILIFGGCVLTYAQYGRFDETFTGNLFMKIGQLLGLSPSKEVIKRFLKLLPPIFIVLALIYQIVLKYPILVHLRIL